MVTGSLRRIITSCLLAVFLGCLCTQRAYADRPKVAVVLSGGGAMGSAHASVLKVIEEAGIPIDMVVGTSMGSIIGGLYAYGYTPTQLDSILRAQDWMSLLLNAPKRKHMDFKHRMFDDKYILTIPFKRDKKKHLYGGVLSGEAVLKLFYSLTPEHLDSMDFRNLQVPFACVAYDVLENKEIDLYGGVLAECIRASMSIPGVFSPMRKDGMVLVDGGVANNFPVDIAKKMGADVIIGVTLDPEDKEITSESITSTVDVMGRLIEKATTHKVKENLAETDVVINVDTKGYTSASFTSEAVADLLDRGEKAAREKLPELISLRDLLNLKDSVTRVPVQVPREASLEKTSNTESKGFKVGASFRIDNEELASVLLGANYKFNNRLKPSLEAQIRFGRRSHGFLSASIRPFEKWTLQGSFRFYYNETKLYQDGERVLDWDYHEHFARLSLFRTWNYMKLTVGVAAARRKFDHLLASSLNDDAHSYLSQVDYDTEKDFNYYTSVRFDTRDSRVYPHKGAMGAFRAYYETDDGLKYEGEHGLLVGEFYYEDYIPLSTRFTLAPGVWGRFMSTPKYYRLGNRNFIGGTGTLGHYMAQQIPFAGINNFEVIDDKVAVVSCTARYRIASNHHVSAIFNYGNSFGSFTDSDYKKLYGCALGYGYKTPVGPLDFNLNWSNVTEKLGFWLNFGYIF